MNDDTAAVSPRRLVVYLCDVGFTSRHYSQQMIEDDKGNFPQLVYRQRIHHIWNPPHLSRVDRLLIRLRLKPHPPEASEVVDHMNNRTITNVHRFVSFNYRSGDQVILLAEQRYVGDHLIKAMETFAQHLHNGTIPGEPSQAQPGGEKNTHGKRIPIYGVVVMDYQPHTGRESLCLITDKLKTRFPPGIEHIVCHGWFAMESRSCSTVFDLNGGIVAREISMYGKGYKFPDKLTHISKHIIYYQPRAITDWDKQRPIWTEVLDSSPSGIARNCSLSALPAGIHRQELRKYQGRSRLSNRLVWKSSRD